MTAWKQKNIPPSKRHPKEVVDTTVQALNAHIDRLSQSVLPRHPYLISVPSDVPYRHSSRFIPTWYIGTPFEQREEQLQYLSFLPHQGDHEGLLRVVGGWSDDQGSFLEEEPSPGTVYNSGRNTPLEQPTSKKKISLKDYKTKDKMAPDQIQAMSHENVQNKGNVQSYPSVKIEASVGDMKATPRQSEDGWKAKQVSTKQGATAAKSVPHLDGAFSPTPSPTQENHDMSPRPNKRRKLSDSPVLRPTSAHQTDPLSKTMPQLLSPTLPSPKENGVLPELLSPVLPPTLVRAIATPPPQSLVENGNQHHRSESVRSILANAISEGSPRHDNKNGPVTGSLGSRIRSDSAHSARSATSVGPPTNKHVAALKPSTPNLSPSRSPNRPRQRHIIALKYGKKNRKRVEALLKFAARPKKAIPQPSTSESSITRETRPTVPPIKVSREDSTDNAVKSKPTSDASSHARRPTTPVPIVREPKNSSTPTPTANKTVHTTPKREIKSTAMRRVESMDGADPSTPGGRIRSSTPLSVDRTSLPSKLSPGPTSAPQAGNEDRQAWFKLHQRHHELGRTIKHNATDDHEPGTPKYAVLLVEALLSFMISNAAQALSKPSAQNWSQIKEYQTFVAGHTRKFPHLQGLVLQLGAVCRQQILKYDIERLARDPLPDEYTGSAPTPGSDGNTKTIEDGERYKQRYLDFRNDMVSNGRDLQVAWLDGFRRLPLELMKDEYPKTWAARRLDFQRRGTDKPALGDISKTFFLPMDAATAPFEAIGFGLAFLTEWANIHGVKWETRIDL